MTHLDLDHQFELGVWRCWYNEEDPESSESGLVELEACVIEVEVRLDFQRARSCQDRFLNRLRCEIVAFSPV